MSFFENLLDILYISKLLCLYPMHLVSVIFIILKNNVSTTVYSTEIEEYNNNNIVQRLYDNPIVSRIKDKNKFHKEGTCFITRNGIIALKDYSSESKIFNLVHYNSMKHYKPKKRNVRNKNTVEKKLKTFYNNEYSNDMYLDYFYDYFSSISILKNCNLIKLIDIMDFQVIMNLKYSIQYFIGLKTQEDKFSCGYKYNIKCLYIYSKERDMYNIFISESELILATLKTKKKENIHMSSDMCFVFYDKLKEMGNLLLEYDNLVVKFLKYKINNFLSIKEDMSTFEQIEKFKRFQKNDFLIHKSYSPFIKLFLYLFYFENRIIYNKTVIKVIELEREKLNVSLYTLTDLKNLNKNIRKIICEMSIERWMNYEIYNEYFFEDEKNFVLEKDRLKKMSLDAQEKYNEL
ncbi:hypothetical protein SLOPH_1145 [Spraguea lophii 42_110]|uniref:Uncharacterized protein n=1 Tax=Spraguea lophii (strain 42_110) TaxID=1358809 RepID=S7XR72_SPRLO|nr:hypothetical protein SLOPH_1145 [Spraguea lophii 42_110]